MSGSTPVTRALDALQIPYRVFQHPGPVETLEQAARERGQEPNQVIRSLVFRITQGEYVMVLMADAQLAIPQVANRLLMGAQCRG